MFPPLYCLRVLAYRQRILSEFFGCRLPTDLTFKERKQLLVERRILQGCVAKSLLRPHLLILHASLQLCFYMTILGYSLS